MRELLKNITESALFRLSIFDDSLTVECRVLSPAEVEASGLVSSMIAQDIMPAGKAPGSSFARLNERIDGRDFEDLEEDLISDLVKAMSTIRPDTVLKMQHEQDKLLCQIVKRASSDGKNWEPLILVNAVDQQDPEKGRLWVGMIPKPDRDKILERAMKAREEASKRIASFRAG